MNIRQTYQLLTRLIFLVTVIVLMGNSAVARDRSAVKAAAQKLHRSAHPRKALIVPQILDVDSVTLENLNLGQASLKEEIENWLNVRYKIGGLSKKGVDCSGFVWNIFQRSLDMDLPRTSREQAQIGEAVEKDSLQFGDLLFFGSKSKHISHVAMYIGGGRIVHSSRNHGVGVSSVTSTYYGKHFVCARRVLKTFS